MRSGSTDSKSQSPISDECVTSESIGVSNATPARPLVWADFSWRCLELFNEGASTAEIAVILEQARIKPPKSKPITEAKVYNALAKARDAIYERGLTMPRVRGGDVSSKGVKP